MTQKAGNKSISSNSGALKCAVARQLAAFVSRQQSEASDFSVLLTRIINYLISDTTHVQQSAKRVKSFCPRRGYTFKQHYPSLAVGGNMRQDYPLKENSPYYRRMMWIADKRTRFPGYNTRYILLLLIFFSFFFFFRERCELDRFLPHSPNKQIQIGKTGANELQWYKNILKKKRKMIAKKYK